MRIGLIAEKYIDNDLDHNFAQMTSWLRNCEGKGYDLLCFGESFAHGFEALSWKHDNDLAVAITQTDQRIDRLREEAQKSKTGIAFGYIEKVVDNLYSSYMVISENGGILVNYRRASAGWKEPIADPIHYIEGSDYSPFNFQGKAIGIAICGDLWHDDLLEIFKNQRSDLLLWPLYINYTPEFWLSGEREAYAEQAGYLKRPVLMINCLSDPPTQAFGGCYVFNSGSIQQELPLGQGGILTVEL